MILPKIIDNVSFLTSFKMPNTNFKIRIFGNKLYYGNDTETFHDFLEKQCIDFLDEEWFFNAENSNHCLIIWYTCYQKFKSNSGIDPIINEDGTVSSLISGPVLVWLAFCYDIFTLLNCNKLSKNISDRLKNLNEFQGAWYEIVISAIILRAGCDFLWTKDQSKRNPEFIATHKRSKLQFIVECKSKRRPGVMNEKGSIAQKYVSSGKLLKSSFGQIAHDIPSIVFIDLNMPEQNNLTISSEQYHQVKKAIDSLENASLNNPDPFSAIYFTNFGFHYGSSDSVAKFHHHITVLPEHSKHKISNIIVDDITSAIYRYGIIPDDI